MLTPAKAVSFQFTSDGTSDSIVVDLTTYPASLNLAGARTTGILQLVVTGSNAVAVPAVTGSSIAGSVLTIAFATPPPLNDPTGAAAVYSVAFLLLLASILTT